jgi:GTP cyclohydrolase I
MSDTDKQIEELKPLLRAVLISLGENPERGGLKKTPQRWAEALISYTQGINQSPEDHLKVIFELEKDEYPAQTDDMVMVDNIEFVSTCEHHMAPFWGRAHIAYIPNPETRRITGLSKLSRLVEVFSNRLQIQERMANQIANAIDEILLPLGVIVVIRAMHFCMIQRGVKQRSSSALTTARRGMFLDNPELETKFQNYLSFCSNSKDL